VNASEMTSSVVILARKANPRRARCSETSPPGSEGGVGKHRMAVRPAPTLLCLSDRDVEELMAARGVLLTYEAVRYWCRKCGQAYAHQLPHRRPRPGDKWHLDEMLRTINKERPYLWGAVDQDGHVLDILVQRRRDKQAAKKFWLCRKCSCDSM
jgi:transposase-like protein